jgi:hypothetical protein
MRNGEFQGVFKSTMDACNPPYQIGFLLDDASFFVHSSNHEEVARFGNEVDTAYVLLYSQNNSNQGYRIGVTERDAGIDFYIHSDFQPMPSFFVNGTNGNVGIHTDRPAYSMEVAGDLYITGQLIQKGSNFIIYSEVIQSTALYADFLYTCNVDRIIDCTSNTLINVNHLYSLNDIYCGDTLYASNLHVYGKLTTLEVQNTTCNQGQLIVSNHGTGPALKVSQIGAHPVAEFWDDQTMTLQIADGARVGIRTSSPLAPLHVMGSLRVEGDPFLHVMGNMQRFEVAVGQTVVPTPGQHTFGFVLSWSQPQLSSDMIFEVQGACYMNGGSARMHHRFHALVNPMDHALAGLPGLDVITDQTSVHDSSLGRSTFQVVRVSPSSVHIRIRWTSALTGYKTNMRLSVFCPTALGTLQAVPLLT